MAQVNKRCIRKISAGALTQAVQESAIPLRFKQNAARARAALRSLGVSGFDAGGLLEPGITASANFTNQPEAVLTGRQWAALISLANDGTRDRPIELDARLYIDGKEIDARIEAKQKDHDKELVRVATARRRRPR